MSDVRLFLVAFFHTLRAMGREVRAISPAYYAAMVGVVLATDGALFLIRYLLP